MIHPDDIQRKAENLYSRFLLAWLEGNDFFPRNIPAGKRPDDDPAAAIEQVRRLRDGSREKLGYGYAIEWKEINSRRHGRNRFPHRILFETRDDFLRYIGRQRQFVAFADAVGRVRDRYPQLDPWIRSHRQLLIEAADDVEGLLLVVDYFCEHPRPGLFARELPLPLDTKFVERNQPILRDWLDILLPPHAIRADEPHFERRYGLRYAEPFLLVRFLDPELQREWGSPWPEVALPLSTLAAMQVGVPRVLIVENKVNLMTLPPLEQTLALGGLGNGVADLRLLAWLNASQIWYWGDLDVAGLAILSRLRAIFPQTASLMMDRNALRQWCDCIAEHVRPSPMDAPSGLNAAERDAFVRCSQEGLRIEQEKIPQSHVISALRAAIADPGQTFDRVG